MRMSACLFLLLGALAVSAAERIVFSSDRSGAWRIWAVAPDGSGLEQVTKAEGDHHDVDPMVSPDAKSILFTSTRGEKTGVWRMATDGSKPERICDGDQAEWAPDGKQIAFRRADRIWVRLLASGKESALTGKDVPGCSGAAWSPDGRRVAFASLRGAANAGGEPRKVYDEKGACEPHWSPDGTLLVYETETHICTIRPDGTKNRLVTWFGGVQRYARYSPDGKHIVFCQAPAPRGPWELYVIPARGGTPRKLTDGGSDMYPHWK